MRALRHAAVMPRYSAFAFRHFLESAYFMTEQMRARPFMMMRGDIASWTTTPRRRRPATPAPAPWPVGAPRRARRVPARRATAREMMQLLQPPRHIYFARRHASQYRPCSSHRPLIITFIHAITTASAISCQST